MPAVLEAMPALFSFLNPVNNSHEWLKQIRESGKSHAIWAMNAGLWWELSFGWSVIALEILIIVNPRCIFSSKFPGKVILDQHKAQERPETDKLVLTIISEQSLENITHHSDYLSHVSSLTDANCKWRKSLLLYRVKMHFVPQQKVLLRSGEPVIDN